MQDQSTENTLFGPTPITKRCCYCKKQVPITEFHCWSRGRFGKANACKPCTLAYQREYNKDPKNTRRNTLLKNRISQDDYDEMVRQQGGGCAICGRTSQSKRNSRQKQMSLCIDHCHKTGVIRGVLCDKCNIGLGAFKDNPALLHRAAEYLEKPR
jgi:recombinational DNA repair protein (RecF pathway)